MTPTRPGDDIGTSERPSGRKDRVRAWLTAYRTPITILVFGLAVSLALFLATLNSAARAREREFRHHAAARIAELNAGFAALGAELSEITSAASAGIDPQTVIDIFTPADGAAPIPPLRDLGLLIPGEPPRAADHATAERVRQALETGAAGEGGPGERLALPLAPDTRGGAGFALLAPLPGRPGHAYVASDFDALAQPTGLPTDPVWLLAGIGDTPPVLAPARDVADRDQDAPDVAALLDHAPYRLHWTAPAPFETVRADLIPRPAWQRDVGALPWFVLAFSLFATGAIGALALKDARRAREVRRQVVIKTAELRRSNAATAAKNERLARFVAHASHDLQAPLRAMKGMSSLLVEREIGLDARSRMLLERINRGADRAQRLVQDLLSYSRADMAELNPETIAPDTLREDIDAVLAAAVEECGGTLDWSLDGPFTADRFLLTRALQNLITNAVKYRSDTPLEIEVSAQTGEHGTTLCVSDNGIGIDPKYFDRIFNVFERLHSNDIHEGSGLGLALCKRVAELHGGRIWVDSEPGVGSRFYLFLPARPGVQKQR